MSNPIVSASPNLAFQSGRDRITIAASQWGYLGNFTNTSTQDPTNWALIFNTNSFGGLAINGDSRVDRCWIYSPRSGLQEEVSTDNPYFSEFPGPFIITAAPIESIQVDGTFILASGGTAANGGAANLFFNPARSSLACVYYDSFVSNTTETSFVAPTHWGPLMGSDIWQDPFLSVTAFLSNPTPVAIIRQPYVDAFNVQVSSTGDADIYRVWPVFGRQTARITVYADEDDTTFYLTGVQGIAQNAQSSLAVTSPGFTLNFEEAVPAPPGPFPDLVTESAPTVTALNTSIETDILLQLDATTAGQAVQGTLNIENLSFLILRIEGVAEQSPNVRVRIIIDDE